MASLVRAWPALLSAALMFAAFPPFNLSLLVFVALAPWFVSLRKTTGWGAFRSGYIFGFVFLAFAMSWLQPLAFRWTGVTALSLVPAILAPLIGGFYFSLLAWLIRYCWLRNWPWMIPVVWSGIEVFRSYCPGLAFPWGLLGTPLWSFPALIQLAWFGTIYLVSGWLAVSNVFVAQLLAGEKFLVVRYYVIAFAFLTFLSISRFSNKPIGAKTAITVGQLGLDLAFGDKEETQRKLGPTVEQLHAAAGLQGSQLLVLPEGLLRGNTGFPPRVPFSVQGGPPMLFGGQRGAGPTYQSAFAYDGAWKYADKTRLVVFGEYVPGRDYMPFLTEFKLPTGDLTPGEKVSSVEVGGIRVGPLLCFEGLFPDVAIAQARNDVQLLAIMSLDDWYFGTSAPEQLMTAAVFRAVETGVPVVRAAPLGYSMACQANGEVVAMAPLGKTVPLRVELTLPAHPDAFGGVSVYMIAAPVLSVLLFGLAVYDRWRGVMDRGTEGPQEEREKTYDRR